MRRMKIPPISAGANAVNAVTSIDSRLRSSVLLTRVVIAGDLLIEAATFRPGGGYLVEEVSWDKR